MGTFVKLADAPKGTVPFQEEDGQLGFVPRPGVNVDYGISFDRERGHRVFFCYADTPHFKNTIAPESLRRFAQSMDIGLHEHFVWRAIFLQQATLADQMNDVWNAAGRPKRGVPEPQQTRQ